MSNGMLYVCCSFLELILLLFMAHSCMCLYVAVAVDVLVMMMLIPLFLAVGWSDDRVPLLLWGVCV